MHNVFAPAVRLMNRLRYPQKFALVGLLLLIPTIVLLTQYLGSINYDIAFADAEQRGLEYNAPLIELLHGIQEHAYYSHLVLSGQSQFGGELQRVRDEMRVRMSAAEMMNAQMGDDLRASHDFLRFRAGWLLLVSQSGGFGMTENKLRHITLQEQLLDVITVVGNNSNLILDPDIDSYYLMDTVILKLPLTTVYLSDTQITGYRMLSEPLDAELVVRLTILSGLIDSTLDANVTGYGYAFERNPALGERMQPLIDDTYAPTRALVRQTANIERSLGSDPAQFAESVSAILSRQYALYDLAARELDRLLTARIAGFEAQRNAVVAVATVAVLAAIYLFIGFYLAVRRTIDDLRHTSDSMVSGKLQKTMAFENHDEFEEVVTAFNNVANEMVVARDRALQASRLKDEFLATMSHELRTPLNSIIGYTGILMSGMRGNVDEVAKGILGRVRDSSHNLLNLINDILDIAKIEAGRMDIVEAPFALNEFVGSVRAQAEVLARQKELNFEVMVDPALPHVVIGDADKLAQVLRNLLSNAVKFTEEGVVRLKVYSKGETLHFEVSDTGIGIPPQALDYIFDEFRQVDGSTRRVYGGTGLGLSIVRKFCLAMGGRITVQSKLGTGSTFTAIVPLRAEYETAADAVRSVT